MPSEFAYRASLSLFGIRVEVESNSENAIAITRECISRGNQTQFSNDEDRPIYVFDEWAADQDPLFKEVFYHQLLPDLKARGKTVIVISHDDRFYHVGDRVIKLENGQTVSDSGSNGVSSNGFPLREIGIGVAKAAQGTNVN